MSVTLHQTKTSTQMSSTPRFFTNSRGIVLRLPEGLFSSNHVEYLRFLSRTQDEAQKMAIKLKQEEPETVDKLPHWRSALKALTSLILDIGIENIDTKDGFSFNGDLSALAKEFGFSSIINPKNETYAFKNVMNRIRTEIHREIGKKTQARLSEYVIISREFYTGKAPAIGYAFRRVTVNSKLFFFHKELNKFIQFDTNPKDKYELMLTAMILVQGGYQIEIKN